MRKITAEEFHTMIDENPSIFKNWKEPLEITEFVDCDESPITHLSKHLTFSGKNKRGWCASFEKCKSLYIATGTFKGGVSFTFSRIEKIENLKVTEVTVEKTAATFDLCEGLEIATGWYAGFVGFSGCNIREINNLHIEKPNTEKIYADFTDNALTSLKEWDIKKKIKVELFLLKKEEYRLGILKEIKRIHSKINATTFYTLILHNPSIFKDWKTPLEITEYVEVFHSDITHLNPLLHFTGVNVKTSACFIGCHKLKTLTGNFNYAVSIESESLTTIKDLHIKNPGAFGIYLQVWECHNLTNLKDWDLSKKTGINPQKITTEKRRRAIKKWHREVEPLPFL
jgi:hypothetical protein